VGKRTGQGGQSGERSRVKRDRVGRDRVEEGNRTKGTRVGKKENRMERGREKGRQSRKRKVGQRELELREKCILVYKLRNKIIIHNLN
jgi:hypothetical protein